MDPLVATPPEEVHLRDAPLVRVIAQIRFPEILSVEQRDFVAHFQEGIRATYPVLRQEQLQSLVLGPAGLAPGKPQSAWRFQDFDGAWRVSLTPEFLALETTRYSSQADFLARLKTVLEALAQYVGPSRVDRLGIRYVNRVTGRPLERIPDFVIPEVRGISGTDAAGHSLHSFAESMFDLPQAQVLARWGVVPANTTVDPSVIEPVPEASWVLDLDMFSKVPMGFAVDGVLAEAQNFSQRIYTIFRWAVTNEFLRHYGGEV